MTGTGLGAILIAIIFIAYLLFCIAMFMACLFVVLAMVSPTTATELVVWAKEKWS